MECEFKLKDDYTWLKAKFSHNYGQDGEIKERFACFSNITKIKEQEIKLQNMAYYDLLTNLPNRYKLYDILEYEISKAIEYGSLVSVAFFGIDDLTRLNDGLGHALGDELLRIIATLLKEYESDVLKIARFSGNQFAIVFSGYKDINDVLKMCTTISNHIKEPINLKDTMVNTRANIGLAEFPTDANDIHELLKNADTAMQFVKHNLKDSIMRFDLSMHVDFLRRVTIENRLRKTDMDKCFKLYYQPQYNAKSKQLRGVEALVRWHDDVLGMVSPAEFIPVAENSSMINEIGAWVLRQAFLTCKKWQTDFGFKGIISINISTIQLRKIDFLDEIVELIKAYDIDTSLIELEITESVFIDDFNRAYLMIRGLKEMGMKISLDDFGTGYSSLSYLKNLPIDTLKIDKSFIDAVTTDDVTGIITSSVISLVHSLGINTVAEGVETDEQFEYLISANCDTIQGYLLGKPMPEEEIEILLRKIYNKN